MAIDRFQKGEVVKVRGEFRTPKTALINPNVLIDPDEITLLIKKPDQTTTTLTYAAEQVVRDDTGKYSAFVELTQEGTYHYRWVGDSGGAATGVSTGLFDSVMEPNF